LFISNRRENKHPNSREEYHSSAQGLYFCSDITTDCSDYETGKLSEVVNRICTARYTFRSDLQQVIPPNSHAFCNLLSDRSVIYDSVVKRARHRHVTWTVTETSHVNGQ